MEDKAMIISYLTLFIGIGLLAFTFISALIYLSNISAITGSSDLVDAFGSALAPLIESAIRIMYLGVMGWIGLGLTTRGVHLITKLKRLPKPEVQPEETADFEPFEDLVKPTTSKKSKKTKK